jgi:hypothetical protein
LAIVVALRLVDVASGVDLRSGVFASARDYPRHADVDRPLLQATSNQRVGEVRHDIEHDAAAQQ